MPQQIYKITTSDIEEIWKFLDCNNLDIVLTEYQGVRALYTALPVGSVNSEFFIRFSKQVTTMPTTAEWKKMSKKGLI